MHRSYVFCLIIFSPFLIICSMKTQKLEAVLPLYKKCQRRKLIENYQKLLSLKKHHNHGTSKHDAFQKTLKFIFDKNFPIFHDFFHKTLFRRQFNVEQPIKDQNEQRTGDGKFTKKFSRPCVADGKRQKPWRT